MNRDNLQKGIDLNKEIERIENRLKLIDEMKCFKVEIINQQNRGVFEQEFTNKDAFGFIQQFKESLQKKRSELIHKFKLL